MSHVFQPLVPITIMYHFWDSRNPEYLMPSAGIFNHFTLIKAIRQGYEDMPPEPFQLHLEGSGQNSWKPASFQRKGQCSLSGQTIFFTPNYRPRILDFGYSLLNYMSFFQQMLCNHDKWLRSLYNILLNEKAYCRITSIMISFYIKTYTVTGRQKKTRKIYTTTMNAANLGDRQHFWVFICFWITWNFLILIW